MAKKEAAGATPRDQFSRLGRYKRLRHERAFSRKLPRVPPVEPPAERHKHKELVINARKVAKCTRARYKHARTHSRSAPQRRCLANCGALLFLSRNRAQQSLQAAFGDSAGGKLFTITRGRGLRKSEEGGRCRKTYRRQPARTGGRRMPGTLPRKFVFLHAAKHTAQWQKAKTAPREVPTHTRSRLVIFFYISGLP